MSILAMLVMAFVVLRMPVIGKYVAVMNTMIHETGHALVSFLTNGSIYSISLFANTSGVTVTKYRSWFGKVLTGLAGYPFASFIGFLFYFMLSNDQSLWVLYLLMGFVALNLMLIRNLYGVIWLLTFGTVLVLLLINVRLPIVSDVLLFFTAIVLIESVHSAFVILYLSLTTRKKAGDATMLAQSTFIPAFIWGLFFFGQALLFSYLSFNISLIL